MKSRLAVAPILTHGTDDSVANQSSCHGGGLTVDSRLNRELEVAMDFNDVKTIAVIGAGDVGHGISLGLALAGYQVNLNSTTEASLQKGMDSINADLDRLVEFGFAEPDRP